MENTNYWIVAIKPTPRMTAEFLGTDGHLTTRSDEAKRFLCRRDAFLFADQRGTKDYYLLRGDEVKPFVDYLHSH